MTWPPTSYSWWCDGVVSILFVLIIKGVSKQTKPSGVTSVDANPPGTSFASTSFHEALFYIRKYVSFDPLCAI